MAWYILTGEKIDISFLQLNTMDSFFYFSNMEKKVALAAAKVYNAQLSPTGSGQKIHTTEEMQVLKY